jgi:hypothetical protein
VLDLAVLEQGGEDSCLKLRRLSPNAGRTPPRLGGKIVSR